MTPRTRSILFVVLIAAVIVTVAREAAAREITTWSQAKAAAQEVHRGFPLTWYCGCLYQPQGTGGTVDLASCGYKGPKSYRSRARVLEWEHVASASGLRGEHPVWKRKGRRACERDPDCRLAILDLHNLVPSGGQTNALRSNDPYRDLPDNISDFGACAIEDKRGAFEPPPCRWGDAARIHLYMADRYGMKLSKAERKQFERWSALDPVSPLEVERDHRIATITGVSNPYVAGKEPSDEGACPWERPLK